MTEAQSVAMLEAINEIYKVAEEKSCEIRYRLVVSRVYYLVFLTARDKYRVTDETSDVHGETWRKARSLLSILAKEHYNALWGYRRTADYRLTEASTTNGSWADTARYAVKKAQWLCDQIKRS
ncbi:MAG: hypothetical protein NT023_05040 [Armatimonadetes bacterium]|nr:hypothetical protein [Armatimonadota bacterium]